ncbi:MAG TPA: alpha-galactosidase [Lachnospiraceae bacterium]|nr:alpha-galactosidase [Lachnospiraceae bacterium]
MDIIFHEKTKQFHLCNDRISYIIGILPGGEPGNLYTGKRIHDREDFSRLICLEDRAMVVGAKDNELFSLELNRQEYPFFGTSDFRTPAFELIAENGSSYCHFSYVSHEIFNGKEKLCGLPAVYTEEEAEAKSLRLILKDELTGMEIALLYTIFRDYPVIARSAAFHNKGQESLLLDRAMSFSLDLPDQDYIWMQFSGAWGREKKPIERRIDEGITAVSSMRGNSSPNHNPFVILRREHTDEFQGEAFGLSLLYSGNFLTQAEADTYGALRLMTGIHPSHFSWELKPGESFQTPEALLVYTDSGLNELSQTLHSLYRKRLSRGIWREKERPILLNNWEATEMSFTEESILKIAEKGRKAGVELFVLDDGWFGARNDDHAGLGDWFVNTEKLPRGIKGLADKIHGMGLKFGLWFEPEMVNPDSDLYRSKPEWALAAPGRPSSLGRHQLVLDMSKPEVVDYLYERMHSIIAEASIDYVKWDMNRTISECYSTGREPSCQGRVYHEYILGVYSLYERLIADFPELLFESCASGGSRYDAGMLYYAPQTWGSDDTDAIERLKIQYGISYGYPISSIGAHVSVSPNMQTGRVCSIATRAAVACFGTFGYEMDLNSLSDEEFEEIKQQISFMKEYRGLIQSGRFYRLLSPIKDNYCAWMVVSEDGERAIVAYYRILAAANPPHRRLKLTGLLPDACYNMDGEDYYGSELMQIGIEIAETPQEFWKHPAGDFASRLIVLHRKG